MIYRTRREGHVIFVIFVLMAVFGVTLVASSSCGEPVTMTLTNNEYKGIVVAIDKNVEENAVLLQNIKKAFTEASKLLYSATKQRAFFKEITILVPTTWNQNSTEYETAGKELYENSHIRIKDSSQYDSFSPFVKQFNSECGKTGLYMHFNPKFFTDQGFLGAIKSSGLGRIILHEFGHLRWGLYDEYPTVMDYHDGRKDPLDKVYYWDTNSGQFEATRCTLAVEVTPDCVENNSSLANCTNYSVNDNQTAQGSIMFGRFLQELDSFCDDNSSNPLTHHNRLAPNRQNRVCAGKSTWTVINETPDFGDSNPPRDVEDTTPTFRVVQQKNNRRVVLVLDISGSMNRVGVGSSSTRLERMNQAASIYLNKVIDDCSYVGIVTFATTASIEQNLTHVKNNRQTLVDALPPSTTGSTCIGCGIQKGLEILQEGGYMLVISDGGENVPPLVVDVTYEVIAAGVVVDSLAFSQQAAPALADISDATGGTFFYTSDSDSATSLFESLLKTIECRPFDCENRVQSITVESTSTIVNGVSNKTGFVYIDSSLGNHTVFIFTWEDGAPLVVYIISPSGDVYSESYTGYTEDSINKVVSVDIAGTAENGAWTYIITNPNSDQQEVAIIISSSQQSSDDPILVDSYFSNTAVNFASGDKQSIFAEVTKGFFPVLNATVEALLETPSGTESIRLLDNGAGADLDKDDGVYSAFVTNIVGNGRYGVKIQVRNDGEAVIKSYVVGEKVILPAEFSSPQKEVETAAEQFSRTGSAGAFTVNSYDSSIDPYPPSRIIDFQASAVSVENQTVTLTWTAVGSDLDTGTASEYDLRTSFSVDDLYDRFENVAKINQSDILIGDLHAPLAAGSKEEFTILLKDVEATYFIAVRAIDENGNSGEISNIVQVGIFIQQLLEGRLNPSDSSPIEESSPYPNSLKEVTTVESILTSTLMKQESSDYPNSLEEVTTVESIQTSALRNQEKKNNNTIFINQREMSIYIASSVICGIIIIITTIYMYYAYKKSRKNIVSPADQQAKSVALQYTATNSQLWSNSQSEVTKEKEETIVTMFYDDFYTKNDLKEHYSHLDG